jgi:hypothetical protein
VQILICYYYTCKVACESGIRSQRRADLLDISANSTLTEKGIFQRLSIREERRQYSAVEPDIQQGY